MSRYTSATDAERRAMLETIGVGSVDELFAVIPKELRFSGELDIPAGCAEVEVLEHLGELAARNVSAADEVTFVGAGMYDHYVPAAVEAMVSRSELQTSYTPYQPELSQGNLQAIFEFQTAISELTGLPVANASLYDGPSAAAEAAYLAKVETGRTKLVLSRGVDPQAREVVHTLSAGFGTSVVEAPLAGGRTSIDELARLVDEDTAAVFIGQPNFLGAVEDLAALGEVIKASGALFVVSCDPLTLGVLAPPGRFGADIALGEGQALGNELSFGGPSFGFFAAAESHVRRMPGRIAGQTVDVDGKRGFVLTLQTREQHIRREKATSNICTNQALNALAGQVYLSWLGKRGIIELGELMLKRTAYLRERLHGLEGVAPLCEAPVVREFALALDAPVEAVIRRCRAQGIACGYPLGRAYPEHANGLLVAVTERRSRAQLDRLVEVLGQAITESREDARTMGLQASRGA